jgi:orotidine-5'-phosphate decarboxylase
MLEIDRPMGIIPACDVPIGKISKVAEATTDIQNISALKIGGITALEYGLADVIETVKDYNDGIPIIFDYQKAGNDIPDMGQLFAETVYSAGADAVIIFPFAGIKTEKSWIRACQDAGLIVYVGGHMTHPGFLAKDGGFISDPSLIYQIAAEMGVQRFVVPGNHPELVRKYRQLLTSGVPGGKFRLVAPGFLTQGGNISETGLEAGPCWDAIIGRAITRHDSVADMRTAIIQMIKQISQ